MCAPTQNNFGLCSLEITSARLDDSGLYIIKASNVAGQTTCSASLQVEHGNFSHLSLTAPRPTTVSQLYTRSRVVHYCPIVHCSLNKVQMD